MFEWFKNKKDGPEVKRDAISPLASLKVGDTIKIESYKDNIEHPSVYGKLPPKIQLCIVEGNCPDERNILLAVGYVAEKNQYTVEKRVFSYDEKAFKNYNTLNKQPRSDGRRLSYDLTVELAEMVVNNDIRAKKLAEKILNL